ncbi:MAG: (d)CMP kinase, partial [Oscillospiraceae bacterium]
TASPEVRANRRCAELRGKDHEADYAAVLEDIRQRDFQDSNRAVAPMKPAPDAILLDTSDMNFEEVVTALTGIIEEKRSGDHDDT